MNIGGTCSDSVVDHGVNELNNGRTVDRLTHLIAKALDLVICEIGIEFLSSLRRTLSAVCCTDSIEDTRARSKHKNDLVSRTELKLVLDKKVERVVDSNYELVVIKTDRNNNIFRTELLVEKLSCLRINIDTAKIDDWITVLARNSTKNVKFRHKTHLGNYFAKSLTGLFLNTQCFG